MSCEGILWLSQGNLPNRPQAAAISSTFLLPFGQIVQKGLAIRAFWAIPSAGKVGRKGPLRHICRPCPVGAIPGE